MSQTITKDDRHQRLLGYILGNQASWFVDIGLKAGLLRAIADAGAAGITPEGLAGKLGYAERYLAVWCRGAYAFELLDWDEEAGYRLASHVEVLLLDSADPQFIGGRIQFATALYEDYLAFPEHLRTGAIWPRSEHEPFLLEALASMTRPDCVMITEQVLPQAPGVLERLEGGGTLLDVGAGAGEHAIHYARRFPRSRIVGLEPDGPSVALALRASGRAGLGNVAIRHADANELDDERAFDLVTMNVTLHETGGPDEYRNVLERVRQALRPGGAVIVSELPYPDSPRAYREQAVYKLYAGIQLHEALVGCGMITQGQLGVLLDSAGFTDVRVAEQSVPTRFVMIGERPR